MDTENFDRSARLADSDVSSEMDEAEAAKGPVTQRKANSTYLHN